MIINEQLLTALAFLTLIAFLVKPIGKGLNRLSDERSTRIKAALEEAEQLRIEAENVLKSYNVMLDNVKKEAEDIMLRAEHRVSSMIQSAKLNIDSVMEKRKIASLQQISSYEAEILKNLQTQAVNIAIGVVQKMLKERLINKASDPTFKEALAEINKKLH